MYLAHVKGRSHWRHAYFCIRNILANRATFDFYRQMIFEQSISRDELDAINWERCRTLVNYAYEKVPFYREKYKSIGFFPDDLKKRDDFEKLPIITKAEIRDAGERMISEGIDKSLLIQSTTGGSTGVPLRVYHDARFEGNAIGWQIRQWWGISPYENVAKIWRGKDIWEQNQSFLMSIRRWPYRLCSLDASSMTNNNIDRFIEKVQLVRPSVILGYIGAVEDVARYILDKGREVPIPKVAMTTAAPVSSLQREIIEAAFHCPVMDQYGSCEVGFLATQCPASYNLHAHHNIRKLEFVDPSGKACKNAEGDVLVTDLFNFVHPFIRYQNGDRGQWVSESCACGCNFPLIAGVKGRISDRILTPSGVILSGSYLTTIFDAYPKAVRQFQVYQRKDYSIVLRVVKNEAYIDSEKYANAAKTVLFERCRGEVEVRLEFVHEILNDRGKTRFIVSDIEGH